MKKTLKNQKGFTLIELMIVIAIIGILAAIAIPNFIAYRNKSFCSGVETDAANVAAAIADYFSIPSNRTVTDASLENAGVRRLLTNNNTWDITGGNNPNAGITITVTDASGRCPSDYTDASTSANSPLGYWSSATQYRKIMD